MGSRFYQFTIILLIFYNTKVICYEKTLRKIVRNQSKMVQTPFSEDDGNLVWKNASQSHSPVFPRHIHANTVYHKKPLSKLSALVISSAEPIRSKLSGRNIFDEGRLANISIYNVTSVSDKNKNSILFPNEIKENIINNSYSEDIAVDTFYQISAPLNILPLSKGRDTRRPSYRDSIVIPDDHETTTIYGSSLLIKGTFRANVSPNDVKNENFTLLQENPLDLDSRNENPDFLIEATSANDVILSGFKYNVSVESHTCVAIKEVSAEIDSQKKFTEFDIEPSWMTNKHFWNRIFDSRYESLMRNPKWPPLKVIIVPRTHVDTIWKKSFERYHTNSVSKILSNIVKKLQFYNNFTFSWNEVSHLSHWWKTTNTKNRATLRRLVKMERLEITTGGWVEPDEATTHLFGLVHQLIEGHQWLKYYLNYTPKVAWLTNSVTHSPTVAYLLSASDISKLILTNLHYAWEQYLAEYQHSDFIWLQNWDHDKSSHTSLDEDLDKIGTDRIPRHSVLTHYLQFNSDGFRACGPNQILCLNDYNFAKSNKNMNINPYNIKDKSELLLEQYSKTGTITPHNVIIAPIGGPYRFETQDEFDYQYNNYQKIIDYLNNNRETYKATLGFGTAKHYFDSIIEKYKDYPTIKGDFLNFADLNTGSPAYWTGFFTSRPLLKIMLRRLQSTLKTTEILITFAVHNSAIQRINMSNIIELLIKARETFARLLDRNVASGTLTASALKYVQNQILTTLKDCWYIQEVTTSLLITSKELSKVYVKKYVYRDGEVFSTFKTVSPGDQIIVFNSLSHERTELVELITTNNHVRIIDYNKKDVTIQINPVWKHNSDNYISMSRRFYKITFIVVIPPLTFELYRIQLTYDTSQNAATVYCLSCRVSDVTNKQSQFPFTIQPLGKGDILLESFKYRLIFDELTGFLKTVIEKDTNIEKSVIMDYGAFRSSHVNAGMFLFNTNVTKPLSDILMPYRVGTKQKVVMIITGHLTTEIICIYGQLLQQTIKIFNLLNGPLSNAIYVESKVDYDVSPKNRELELFISIQTDIANGNPPELHTDNNGFQYTSRVLNISRRIESNLYPITSMAYIQDHKTRITVITDHAQGVTSLQEGQLVLMLDRRVLYNDGRGTNEGLADNRATCHRHIILLENFISPSVYHLHSLHQNNLKLPSLSAVRLANSLNDPLDIFVINQNQTGFCHYSFLPLIKTSFPCDVNVLNYRINLRNGEFRKYTPNSALLILHRQSFSCELQHGLHLHCNGETNFNLDKIIQHHISSVFKTNLAGTDEGIPITVINQSNFLPMELMTLKIHF